MEKYYINSTKYAIQERQTKKHGKVYDCVFRIITLDGQVIQKKLGGFPTKTALRAAYTEFVTKHCELVKGNPAKNKKAVELIATASFSELFAEYLIAQSGQIKESSLYDTQNIYRLFFKPTFGDLRVADISQTMLIDWQEKLWAAQSPTTHRPYSTKYKQKIRGYLRTFLSWCEYKYKIPNQMQDVRRPKNRAPQKQMDFWTLKEFRQFFSVISTPEHRALFGMLFYCGRRKSEVFALGKDDVQKTQIWFGKTCSRKTVDGTAYKITSTKNERSGYSPICKPLQQILAEYTPQEPFYFGGARPLAENTVTRLFNKYIKESGVKKIRMHDLRHSFVSMLIHLGANIYTVAKLIGDTPEQVLKTYGHLYTEDVRKIISKIA